MRTVIFDLDGTLADTAADLVAAANACFRQMGHGDVLDAAADSETALKGGRSMLRLGFARVDPAAGEAVVDDWYGPLLAHYEGALDRHTVMYPGATRAVQALRGAGYATGICTNKPEGLAEKLMVSLGVRDLFGALVGADTLPVRKPDPAPFMEAVRRAGGDPGAALMVGDTATDHDTARAAGVPSVLVTFGSDGDALRGLGPDALLADFDDLSGVVRRLIG